MLDLILSNPQVSQFLSSVVASASKDAGEKVGKWVVDALSKKIKGAKLFEPEAVSKTEIALNGFLTEGKNSGLSLAQNFWLDFFDFMFPDMGITIENLDEKLSSYIANRIYYGIGFEQLLINAGYKFERIHYMTSIQGQDSLWPYYFDLVATYEQEYFDNLILARVVDWNVNSPQDYVNSLPSLIRDINGYSTVKRPLVRDHDIISIIISNDLSTRQSTKLRQIIRTVQGSNDIFLPRIVLFTSEEIGNLLACQNEEERGKRVLEKFKESRPYRGI